MIVTLDPMPIDKYPALDQYNPKRLEIRIALLEKELEEVQQKMQAFEAVLRTQLSELIVEAQELHILHKAIKKAKKAKRLEQKKRGKNYREPKGLQTALKKKDDTISLEDQQEKKRLYREAMLHVHPDKFSMSEEETATATEVTSRLIEIYKTESLETLRAYHAHIFQGNLSIVLGESADAVKVSLSSNSSNPSQITGSKNTYLLLTIKRLEAELIEAKNRHLYKVVTEYTNPLSFVDELKEYYGDRIVKLKKRTRKGL